MNREEERRQNASKPIDIQTNKQYTQAVKETVKYGVQVEKDNKKSYETQYKYSKL